MLNAFSKRIRRKIMRPKSYKEQDGCWNCQFKGGVSYASGEDYGPSSSTYVDICIVDEKKKLPYSVNPYDFDFKSRKIERHGKCRKWKKDKYAD